MELAMDFPNLRVMKRAIGFTDGLHEILIK